MNSLKRPRYYLVIFALLALFVFIAIHVNAFVQIFFEHSGHSLSQHEVLQAHGRDSKSSRPQFIPKIIHQIYHDWNHQDNETMPTDWDQLRQTCMDLNPGWKYSLWTTKSSRDLIETYYPWFLSAYDGYKYPVQRVDVVKYFIMLKYGGIYLDLDNGCMRDLDPLLYYPTWTTDGGCGALSNNIFGSVPDHPFWVFLTNSLIHYNYNYFFPYITISYASGQWFETAVWQSYHETHNEALHRLNMDERPGAEPYIFFSQARGGSWNNWDNYLFLWLGDNLAVLGFGLVALGCLLLWLARRCTVRRAKTGTVWGFKRRVSTGRKLDAV